AAFTLEQTAVARQWLVVQSNQIQRDLRHALDLSFGGPDRSRRGVSILKPLHSSGKRLWHARHGRDNVDRRETFMPLANATASWFTPPVAGPWFALRPSQVQL